MVDVQDHFKSMKQDYAKVFNTEQGQRVLRDLMVQGHIFEVLPSKTSEDIFFAEGQRNMVIYILNRLQEPRDPARFIAQEQAANLTFNQLTGST